MEAVKNLPALDMLEDIFQCPICLEIPRSSVLQCETGHHICVFCRNKVEQCPLCMMNFIPTRVLFAEELAQKFETIKFSILEEIVSAKMKCQKMSADACIQTSFEVDDASAFTHTIEKACTNLDRKSEGNDYYERRSSNVEYSTYYPCRIGSCTRSLSYKNLLHHVKSCHADFFYTVDKNNSTLYYKYRVYNRPWTQIFDFALHTYSMGLFFLHITVHTTGRLLASVEVANNVETSRRFHYEFHVMNGTHKFHRRGQVSSCLRQLHEDMVVVNPLHSSIPQKLLHKANKENFYTCSFRIMKQYP